MSNLKSVIKVTSINVAEFSKLLTCLGDPSKFRMVARLHPPPGELIGTFEMLFEKAVYSRKMNALIIKIDNTLFTIYASGIVTMTRLGNTDQGLDLLDYVLVKINQFIKGNNYESLMIKDEKLRNRPDPMELIVYLPRTNCMQCGVKSCFYFCTMLALSEITLEKCKFLNTEENSNNRDALNRLTAYI